jgi:hypothetical protein
VSRKSNCRKASDLLYELEHLRNAKCVVIWVRVSGRQQKHRRNQTDQCDSVMHAVDAFAIPIIEVVTHIGSGKQISDTLLHAISVASDHGAALIAESVDRFVRHPDYHSSLNPDAQAGGPELKRLASAASGVSLVTVLHPDTPPNEVRSFQRRRGQHAKQQTGGGDRTPGFRKRHVLRLNEAGMRAMEIVSETRYPKTSVCRWLNEAKQKSQIGS